MTPNKQNDKDEIDKEPSKKKSLWKRLLKIFGIILLSLILLLIAFVFVLRTPWGQDLIVQKATRYVSKKTQTEVSIEKLFITFSGDINLQGLYLEDQKGDTLLYSRELVAGIPFIPILKGQPIALNHLKWDGFRANISRKDSIQGFNFQFLIDAFVDSEKEENPLPENKTTESDPPKIALGRIDFSDFLVNYDDAVLGMKSRLQLGDFHFLGKDFDLKEMRFEIREINLEDTEVSYEQFEAFPEAEEDTTQTTLPFVSVGQITFKNVAAYYHSEPDSLEARGLIADLLLEIPKADLGKQRIELNHFHLNDSDIWVKTNISQDSEQLAKEGASQVEQEVEAQMVEAFKWPDWEVSVKVLGLANNHLHYQNGNSSLTQGRFDPDNIELSDFNLQLENIALSPDRKLMAELREFNFKEASGFDLEELKTTIKLEDTGLELADFSFKTKKSKLLADLKSEFESLDELIEHPDKTKIDLKLTDLSVDLADAFHFQPELKSNEYLAKLSRYKIKGKANAKGSLASLNLANFSANWGPGTRITAKGNFRNLTDTDRLWMNLNNLEFNTRRDDVLLLVSEEDLGIKIPENIRLTSNSQGGLNDLRTLTVLTIPDGTLRVEGSFKNTDELAFDGKLEVLEFDLGKFLDSPDFGMVDFGINASGHGKNLESLDAVLESEFRKLELNHYDYSALKLEGELHQGEGDVALSHKDLNLDFLLDSKIHLDSIGQKVGMNLNINGIDFQNLSLIDKDLRAKLILNADFENRKGSYYLTSQISEATAVLNDRIHHLGKLGIEGFAQQDSTSLHVSSHFLNLDLGANADPERIGKSLTAQFQRYWKEEEISENDEGENPVVLKMDMDISRNELINNVFVPGVKEMDTIKVSVDFRQDRDLLLASLYLPHINYNDNEVEGLYFNTNSGREEAQFIVGFEKLDAGAFGMNRTFFNGDLAERMLSLNFYAFNDQDDKYYSWHSQISGNSKAVEFHLLPFDLILNNEEWQVPEDNYIRYADKRITARNFEISHENHSLFVGDDLQEGLPEDNIGIGFKNFDLKSLLALFNPDDHLAEGHFEGHAIVTGPLDQVGLLADLGIHDLAVMQTELGDLQLKATSEDGKTFDYGLTLKGPDIDLDLNGDFLAGEDPEVNANLQLNHFGFKTIAQFSQEELKEAQGYLSGAFEASGKLSDPIYSGFLKFNDASFKITQLNTEFYLTDDKIEVDNKGFHLSNFSIEDMDRDEFTIDGSISMENFRDPGFDLKLNAQNFLVMNSTSKDNKMVYGKVDFSVNGTVKGKMSFPKIDLKIGANKGTDFTYVMLDSQAALEKQDGIVEFVNKENPDDILTKKRDSINLATITGIRLHANLKLDKNATFNVILDPRTRDNFRVSGEGDLDFRIDENGQMGLTGRYIISGGHYRMSLYNLVKREFNLQPGGTISWNGNPLDADLDVSATYSVKTSAAGLMTGQSVSDDPQESNKYRQRLPFLVILGVKGTIDRPELGFGLNMPDDSKGALGGTVYGRITELNQEDEGELNKQVFSLLVMNRFFPEGGSDGGQGGFATIARDNLNDALSDQLNNFSDQLMGDTGIKLNFGLESYTDYQGNSPQDRTNLDISAEKSLFNDRLIVKAGTEVNLQGENRPGEENPLLGDLSIEYLLTEDGRWRLRGFRKDEYENVIDGQVFINGIGLLFERDFNNFSYLWRSLFGNPDRYFAEKREEWRKKREERKAAEQQNDAEKEEDTIKKTTD